MNKELLEEYLYRSLIVKITDDEEMKKEIKALYEKLADFRDVLDEIDSYADDIIFATAPGSKDEDDMLDKAMMLIKHACRS